MEFKKTTLIALFSFFLFNLTNAQIKEEVTAVQKTLPIDYTFTDGIFSPLGIITAIDNIIVESGTLNISANTTFATITVKAGAALTVDAGATLTASLLNLKSTSSLYSSFICEGNFIGVAKYHRHTEQLGTNDLISSPVSGQLFESFALQNLNIATSGLTVAFAPFNTASGAYTNYNMLSNLLTEIESGKGYRSATTDNGDLIFTGSVITSDVNNVTISDAAAGYQWNLIGNPYPSYVDFEAFFNLNKSQFQTGAYQAIYGYDGDTSDGWLIWNQAVVDSPTVIEKLAPGQAFFVKSKMGGGTVEFKSSMRCTGDSDDFIAGRSETTSPHHGFIKLNSSSNDSNYDTQIYFNSNATSGFDPGYDSGVYGQSAPAFSLYSNLVEDNTGVALAIQALNPDSMYDAVIPLGVNASQGQEITISITETDMPDTVEIYLDDTENSTSTLLTDMDYVFTTDSDISGTGRFYLRYSSDALNIDNTTLDELNIISNNSNDTIEIKGQLYNDTKAELYDINGRLILESALNSKSTTQILDVKYLIPGIYVIALNDNTNVRHSEKLIIK
ncbi:T9SS type A sorting domain-containing protein [Winogradskyella eckloniae]|uniref:T9SS type A sorting domain-containing protein n=1 Tax=Winogradskyella eckloniae TaxID=1089306 RepID=UPI00156554E4|nr:T9SS type A sorting domain-containing protein [Winogradskyella eckloniae]NRD20087.1 T9SS type A sorting domain-containing protein [Winogradskyella eckloniae]